MEPCSVMGTLSTPQVALMHSQSGELPRLNSESDLLEPSLPAADPLGQPTSAPFLREANRSQEVTELAPGTLQGSTF